jgi:hypothetical protein
LHVVLLVLLARQKKPVFIYRLVSVGTAEEVVYLRQVRLPRGPHRPIAEVLRTMRMRLHIARMSACHLQKIESSLRQPDVIF